MNVSLPVSPDQSLSTTLDRVERVVWALLFGVWALFLISCVVGALVVSEQAVSPVVAALVVTSLAGTVVFAVADVAFG